MVNTHEISLDESIYDTFIGSDFVILEIGEIEINDYILFKRTSGTDPATETGQYQMIKVRNIINHDGFKDGYALVMVSNL